MVPVADRQALCLEQNAGLAIIGDTQRAIGPHQGLKQLPLAVGHPRLVPVKRLRAQKNGLGCESKKVCVATSASWGRGAWARLSEMAKMGSQKMSHKPMCVVICLMKRRFITAAEQQRLLLLRVTALS